MASGDSGRVRSDKRGGGITAPSDSGGGVTRTSKPEQLRAPSKGPFFYARGIYSGPVNC